MKKNYTLLFSLVFLNSSMLLAQRIYNGEAVQVVGSFNGYNTSPYNTDYRTTHFRIISTTPPTTTATSNITDGPTDGRGQWATTIQIPSADAVATNMFGGGGNGFLFISGPLTNRFQNKWVFNGVGQAALNSVNDCEFNGTTDMGLDLSATAYYTFVFNDCGYTTTNAKYYVGKTSAMPVTISFAGVTVNADSSATVTITTSTLPSPEENIFVRYVDSLHQDFSGNYPTYIVQAIGNGTNFLATIPPHPLGSSVKYYIFTSTRTLVELNASSETDKSLATLNYNDNNNANYIVPIALATNCRAFSGILNDNEITLKWNTCTDVSIAKFEIEKQINTGWKKIGEIIAHSNIEGSNYLFTDKQLITNNVYRIKFLSTYGNISYGKIISINKNTPLGIAIFPTVVFDNSINIKSKVSSSTNLTIVVTNTSGKILQTRNINLSIGENIISHQFPNLVTGMYFITLNDGINSKSTTIFVK